MSEKPAACIVQIQNDLIKHGVNSHLGHAKMIDLSNRKFRGIPRGLPKKKKNSFTRGLKSFKISFRGKIINKTHIIETIFSA